MAWIQTIPDDQADRTLGRLYEAARQRAGKVFNVVRVQGLNPDTMRTGIGHYQQVMFGDSVLSRAQREMIAMVVSKANNCLY